MKKKTLVVHKLLLIALLLFVSPYGSADARRPQVLDSSNMDVNQTQEPYRSSPLDSAPVNTEQVLDGFKSTDAHKGTAGISCETKHASAEKTCTPPEWLTVLVTSFTMAIQMKDSARACGAAANIQQASSAANLYYGTRCLTAANTCISTCNTELAGAIGPRLQELTALKGSCSEMRGNAMASYTKAAFDQYQSYLNRNCQKELDKNNCSTMELAAKNSNCAQFCSFAQNKGNAACSCENANYKAVNQLECFCKEPSNSNSVACREMSTQLYQSTTQTNPEPTSTWTPTVPGDDGPLIDDPLGGDYSQDYAGNGEAKGSESKTASIGDGNAGGPQLSGGGSAGFGSAGGGGGVGEGPYNTEIERGGSASNNGGAPGGGGGGYESHGGGAGFQGQRGTAAATDEPKFDWKKYLPKMGADNKRSPAGLDPKLFNVGITESNGLSNFEKVTRKMNEKRPQLIP